MNITRISVESVAVFGAGMGFFIRLFKESLGLLLVKLDLVQRLNIQSESLLNQAKQASMTFSDNLGQALAQIVVRSLSSGFNGLILVAIGAYVFNRIAHKQRGLPVECELSDSD